MKKVIKLGLGTALAMWVMLVVTPAQAADPRAGAKLYNMHCTTCHGARGVARMPGVPDFRRGGALFKSDPQLLQMIEQGGGVMPAFRGLMSTYEIMDVIAYLRTLR